MRRLLVVLALLLSACGDDDGTALAPADASAGDASDSAVTDASPGDAPGQPDANLGPDARPGPLDAAPLEQIPDPTGTFYVTFVVTGVDPDDGTVINFIWTLDATKDGSNRPVTVAVSQQELSTIPNGRLSVGTPVSRPAAAISLGGEFRHVFQSLVIVGDANFTGGDLTVNMTLDSSIKTADVICGRVSSGSVTSPIPLDLTDSTFVAVRVPVGEVGTDLPPPTFPCPPQP